ncbi:MAG TPA: hypothetical protein VFI73_03045 [Candidatus Nitrosopolaris sp.]|nr:hypothetical protein [Candidatus Nitrosopolaris sp.]
MNESPPSSDGVRIRLKHHDWEVEISCIETQVKEVVENVLSGLDSAVNINSEFSTQIAELRRQLDTLTEQVQSYVSTQRQITNPVSLQNKMTQKGGITCRGLLQSLWEEGYFRIEKPLGEVHEELSRRGFNYDRTAVSHSLTDMVRENILTRQGTMRNYHYIQKKPPSESPSQ